MWSVVAIASIIIFVVIAVSGYMNGLYSTIVMAFAVLLSASLALALFLPMSRLMPVAHLLSWYGPGTCYLLTFVLALVIFQTLANYMLPPKIELPKAFDRAGGAMLGAVLGLFTAGALTVGLMMLPGTGGPDEKNVVLNCDRLYVKSMAWLSGWAGSKPIDAAAFLSRVKAERMMLEPKRRVDETDIAVDNSEAARQLGDLWNAIEKYAATHADKFPPTLADVVSCLHPVRQKTEKGVAKGLKDPVTGLTYRFFPFETLQQARSDARENIVAWTRGIGGENGDEFMYLANNRGKRPVLYADGQVRWLDHDVARKAIRDQVKRVLGEAGPKSETRSSIQ